MSKETTTTFNMFVLCVGPIVSDDVLEVLHPAPCTGETCCDTLAAAQQRRVGIPKENTSKIKGQAQNRDRKSVLVKSQHTVWSSERFGDKLSLS